MIRVDVGLLPQEPVDATASLAAEAEALGFGGVWVADSHDVFRDAFVALALCADRTRTIRLATGVSNPVTRHPAALAGAIATIDELSDGRAVLGLGVGESAVRNAGLAPASLAGLERAVGEIRDRVPGVPIVVAASGPKALALAGRIADGVLVQIGARPELVRWALERIREPRPPVYLRLAFGRPDDVRSYAAAAANTIARAVPEEAWPADLAGDLRELRAGYDYARHVGSAPPHAGALTGALLEAVAVDDPTRLRELAALVDRLVVPVVGADKRRALAALAEAAQ
jgi:5,10-methylenetetrahydromethanopterin reductase